MWRFIAKVHDWYPFNFLINSLRSRDSEDVFEDLAMVRDNRFVYAKEDVRMASRGMSVTRVLFAVSSQNYIAVWKPEIVMLRMRAFVRSSRHSEVKRNPQRRWKPRTVILSSYKHSWWSIRRIYTKSSMKPWANALFDPYSRSTTQITMLEAFSVTPEPDVVCCICIFRFQAYCRAERWRATTWSSTKNKVTTVKFKQNRDFKFTVPVIVMYRVCHAYLSRTCGLFLPLNSFIPSTTFIPNL